MIYKELWKKKIITRIAQLNLLFYMSDKIWTNAVVEDQQQRNFVAEAAKEGLYDCNDLRVTSYHIN